MVANLSEISFLDFSSSGPLQRDPANLISGRWGGKMSEEEVVPWIMMDIGFKGILLLVIFTVKAAFSLFAPRQSKWRDRVQIL